MNFSKSKYINDIFIEFIIIKFFLRNFKIYFIKFLS